MKGIQELSVLCNFSVNLKLLQDFPGDTVDKNPAAIAEDTGSIPGSERSPGEGNGLPTPVFLPGKSHGQRSLVGYSPMESQRIRHNLQTKQ